MVHVVDPNLQEVAGHDPASFFGERTCNVVFKSLLKRCLAAVPGLRRIELYASRLVFDQNARLGNPRVEELGRVLQLHRRLERDTRHDVIHSQNIPQQGEPEFLIAPDFGILRKSPELSELPRTLFYVCCHYGYIIPNPLGNGFCMKVCMESNPCIIPNES